MKIANAAKLCLLSLSVLSLQAVRAEKPKAERILGSKEQVLQYRFKREDLNMELAFKLNTQGAPATLELPSMRVETNVLGVSLILPFVEVEKTGVRYQRTVVVKNPQFVMEKDSGRVHANVDLSPEFDFGGMPLPGEEEDYKLVLTFDTNEVFSFVNHAQLKIIRTSKAEGATSASVEEAASYDLEEIQYQLPIYWGDES